MAKRRKVRRDEEMLECFYCGKPVDERAWRCPHCGHWFNEGKIKVAGVIVVALLIVVLIAYTVETNPEWFGLASNTGGGGPARVYGVSLWTHQDYESHDAEPGGETSFALFAKNTGNTMDIIDFSTEGVVSGLLVDFEFDAKSLAPDEAFINIFSVSPSPQMGIGNTYSVRVVATSRGDHTVTDFTEVSVRVFNPGDERVVAGNYTRCNYIGWFPNGEEFDSTEGKEPLRVYTGIGDPAPEWKNEGYTKVIEGFRKGLIGMKVGQVKVVRISPEDGYKDGKWRIFQIELVSIDG